MITLLCTNLPPILILKWRGSLYLNIQLVSTVCLLVQCKVDNVHNKFVIAIHHGNEPNGRAYLCRVFGCKEEKGLYLKFSAKSCRGILYPTHKPPPQKKTCPKVKIFKVTRLSTVKVSTAQMWTATATMDMPATSRKQPASFSA